MYPAFSIVEESNENLRRFLIFLGISFFAHISLFAAVLLVQLPNSYKIRAVPPTAISVDLLAFNPEIPMPPPKGDSLDTRTLSPKTIKKDNVDQLLEKVEKIPEPEPEPKLPSAPEPEPKQEPVKVKEALKKTLPKKNIKVEKPPRETITETPVKTAETKKPSVKKNIDASKVLENAVKRMEKQTVSSEADALASRLASLKKEVQGKPGTFGVPYGSATSKSVIPGGGVSGNFTQLQIFQSEVAVQMKNNWVFSEKLAGETKGLESRLVIKIMPDGTITDVWFEKRSGNSYLDNSAYKTIMKSNPLPPLPDGLPYYHLVLGFTPSGLN